MNAVTSVPPATLPREPFDRAVSAVNEWRGRCLDAFTRGEAAITECLMALSTTPGRDGLVGLPHLLGQRFDALAEAIGAGGPFAVEGHNAATALAHFREHASLRNMLCHGVTEVTLDQKGRWTVVLRLAALRSGRIAREVLAMREDEAEPMVADLLKTSRNLRSRLEKLTNCLSATRVAAA